ncbi:MAG: hypothetical protein ACN23H_00685 [Candidatus Phytoplasma vitis]|nr:MAG: hypothetical protein M6G77_00560 [Candidatus Phytoplasma vitis]
MSNPNKLLGQYILRDILQIKPWQLATYDDLVNKQINSILMIKEKNRFKDYFYRCYFVFI